MNEPTPHSKKDLIVWLIQRYGFARREGGPHQGKFAHEWMAEIVAELDALVERNERLSEALAYAE